MNPKTLFATIGLAVLAGASLPISAADEAGGQFFEKSVRPILNDNCFKCHSHSADKIKGGLVVDSLSGLIKGGDSGAALVPGKPEQSLFIKAIRYTDEELQMPPKGKKLPAEQIAILEKWVQMGAPWPGSDKFKAVATGKITDEDRAWWAFQPVQRPAIPLADDQGWSKNPIDKFIFTKLGAAGLKPSVEADRRTLIRRVYYDLWGLPPSPEEISRFAADSSPRAYETMVDRLLQSPRYGERWARHWLDLVRYAESDGYKADGYRPDAWRYRDYVVKSLNDDKPYNRFVWEQLAGDELAPENPDAIAGTMFLRHGIYEYNNPDAKGQWEAILAELTDVTGDVFMGLGMACARCHDHKYDPILQKDYYRLQAFFAPILLRDDVTLADKIQRAEYEKQMAVWREATHVVREEIQAIETAYQKKNFKDAAKKMPDEIQEIFAKPPSERSPYEEQISQLAYRQVAPAFEQLETKLKGEEKQKLVELQKKLAEFDSIKPKPLPSALAATDIGPIAPATYIPKSRTKEPIEPGFLTLFSEKPADIKRPSSVPNSTGRRAALAEWLTRPDNPLASRVMVNRIWQQHFGRGIVSTSSDFGRLGSVPSHPELLDWLASEFVDDGWSLKKIHRLIVTSAAYRQSAIGSASEMAAKKDPENLLLWRMNVRRLDADQVRDSLLAATGELDLEMGGPSVDSTKARRTIYTKVRRNTHDPLLQAFDAPDNISSSPQRNTTTTPTQALLMLNSQTLLQRARALAGRIETQKPANEGELVAAACRFTWGREPDTLERDDLVKFLGEQTERISRAINTPKPVPFLTEAMPARDGKAAIFEADGPQKQFEISDDPAFHKGDFTVEAIVYVKSVPTNTISAAIVSHWDGNETQPGWSFGIAGKALSEKPRQLVLQLAGNAAQGGSHEALLSDFSVDLNKPYYVAAAVQFGQGQPQVTFYAKDLADDDLPLWISSAAHRASRRTAPNLAVTIGSVAGGKGGHQFHGLIDQVRLSRSALGQEKLLFKAEISSEETLGYWQFKSEKDYYKDRSGNGNDIKLKFEDNLRNDPRRGAVEDLCHTLLNSNEFFYID